MSDVVKKYITVTPENNISGDEQRRDKKIYELENIIRPNLNINYCKNIVSFTPFHI